MNEKFNKNAKVEKLSNMFLSSGEEKGLIVKAPLLATGQGLFDNLLYLVVERSYEGGIQSLTSRQ